MLKQKKSVTAAQYRTSCDPTHLVETPRTFVNQSLEFGAALGKRIQNEGLHISGRAKHLFIAAAAEEENEQWEEDEVASKLRE